MDEGIDMTRDLMAQTLTAYGADLNRIPPETVLGWTPAGIVIAQYVAPEGDPDGILMHEGEHSTPTDPVTVRRFYPHPTAE